MPAQNKAARIEAGRRKALGKVVAPDVEVAASEAEAERKDDDLDDPETQWKILNPESLRYRLQFDDGTERGLVVQTEFSMSDVQKRRVYDRMGALLEMIRGEAARQRDRFGDSENAFAVALIETAEDARRLIASISRFEDAKDDEPRPTVDQIAEGMTNADVAALVNYLMVAFKRENDRRKKARAGTTDPA